jgi:hypothetical protein
MKIIGQKSGEPCPSAADTVLSMVEQASSLFINAQARAPVLHKRKQFLADS